MRKLVNEENIIYGNLNASEGNEGDMAVTPAEEELRLRASRYVKAEMKRAGVTYEQLIDKLAEIGLQETKASIANMLGRGSFPATFFIAVMKVLQKESVNMSDF